MGFFSKIFKGVKKTFKSIGKGIKKNHAIPAPISHIDQLPTIFRAMNIEGSSKMEGIVIDDVFIQK